MTNFIASLGKMNIEYLYILMGLFLLAFSVLTFLDKNQKHRIGTGLFWLLFSATFLIGFHLQGVPKDQLRNYYILVGVMVTIMTAIASLGWIGFGNYHESTKEEKVQGSKKYGNWIFLPPLLIPIGVVIFMYFKVNALIAFGISSLIALVAIWAMTRETPLQTGNEGRRMIDSIGWAAILSQFLAALGFLFGKAKVGDVISTMVQQVIPENNFFMAVFAYAIGMTIFTMIMGNAFAAFAVMTMGIGVPLVVHVYGANPAIIGPMAMLSGYCGTLLTPMAANFNVVPAALLEMKNKNGVIKAQILIAIPLFIVNLGLMYFFGMMK